MLDSNCLSLGWQDHDNHDWAGPCKYDMIAIRQGSRQSLQAMATLIASALLCPSASSSRWASHVLLLPFAKAAELRMHAALCR